MRTYLPARGCDLTKILKDALTDFWWAFPYFTDNYLAAEENFVCPEETH